ncbi:MAG: hypothetical protein RLZZ15_1469, partial [Verrucomicrobiota bacterium]
MLLRTACLLLLASCALVAQPAANNKQTAAPSSEPPGISARAAMAAIATATEPSALTVAPGFKVELLYTV